MKAHLKTTLALCFVAISSIAASAWAEAIEQRAPADPKGEVEIVNVSGTVRVIGWNKAEVEVTGEIESRDQLEFTSEGARTFIRVVLPHNRRVTSDTQLIVRIPENSSLLLKTTSADQTIERFRGRQRLQSVSGAINTDIGAEDLYLKTISGDVNVRGLSGETARVPLTRRITAVSGDMTLKGIGGELEIETVSGDLEIEATEVTRARINTTSGDLKITAKLASGARFDAETVNGDVSLDLHGSVDAQFTVRTFNGDIRTCFSGAKVQTRQRGPGSYLDFTQGAGNARVDIRTMNGDVDLCAKAR
jgi:DUF4097 and DUF4098 domain-containing protein YvlB